MDKYFKLNIKVFMCEYIKKVCIRMIVKNNSNLF